MKTWIDSAIGFSPKVCRQLVEVSRKPTLPDRTIMVDTNYLIQVNQKDIASMFFDVNYENTVPNPQKKQMARLFRSVLNRKLDLGFSDFIMREFIGRAPKRKDLLEIYKRHIGVITPKDNLEPCFFDLAAAINSCIIETGTEGDIKDTYSYILAALAGIRYFVTEDKDVERVYTYLTQGRKKDGKAIAREIRKIKSVFKLLSSVPENTFPVSDVLGFLFLEIEPLPIPVSISKLEDQMPDVLDRVETIVWIFSTLQEMAWMKKTSTDLPPQYNKDLVEKAETRITSIALAIGLPNPMQIDPCSFHVRLVEEETKWKEEPIDKELANGLRDQLEAIRADMYREEEEVEYRSREEQFFAEEDTKIFSVVCKNCGNRFEVETYYQGVVESNPREMGNEQCHQWSNEIKCPSCGEEIEIIRELWEYPEFWINYEDTECRGCELVGEKIREPPPTTTLVDFFEG